MKVTRKIPKDTLAAIEAEETTAPSNSENLDQFFMNAPSNPEPQMRPMGRVQSTGENLGGVNNLLDLKF
jgi:hypothetical protein